MWDDAQLLELRIREHERWTEAQNIRRRLADVCLIGPWATARNAHHHVAQHLPLPVLESLLVPLRGRNHPVYAGSHSRAAPKIGIVERGSVWLDPHDRTIRGTVALDGGMTLARELFESCERGGGWCISPVIQTRSRLRGSVDVIYQAWPVSFALVQRGRMNANLYESKTFEQAGWDSVELLESRNRRRTREGRRTVSLRG